MNRFTNNLYDSEIGGNVEESTLGLAQYGGASSFMDYASETVSDTVSSIKKDSIDAKDNITDAAKEVYNDVSNIANAVKNKVVDVADHFINGSNLTSIEPLMTDNLPKSNMTNSQRLNYQSNQNNLDGSATMSLYNNLNKIVGGCDCKKQYCGGFKDDYSEPDENEDLPDSPYNQTGGDISSTEEIINKINQITTGGCDCNKQYCGGDDDFNLDDFDDLPSDLDDENDENDLDSTSDIEDDEEVEFTGGAKSMKPGFSNFINGLYKECKMKGGKKKFNPEAVEWNKKTNEFIQTNFKIDDWDKIKIIKFVANTKNKKEIGEDKLKALSDVQRAKMLYNTVSSMKPAEIKKIDFKKIQAQRVKILKEKFGDKYREPGAKAPAKSSHREDDPKVNEEPKVKEEPKKEKETKKTTKKSTKKGGYDNLFLGGEDSESIRLPGGFRY